MALSLDEKIKKQEAELRKLRKQKKEAELKKKREALEQERQEKIDYMDSLMLGIKGEYQEKFLANLSWWAHTVNKYYDSMNSEENNAEGENQNLNQ